MAIAMTEWLRNDRKALPDTGVKDFAETLEAKATTLELTGSGTEAADLRKWATELRHQAQLQRHARTAS